VKKYKTDKEHLSAADIEAYLNGSLSDNEMHRIERHLLECEFCNEAMDGFEAAILPPNEIEYHVAELNARIETRTQEKKKKVYPFLRIAAIAIALIVSAVFITNYFSGEIKNPQFSEKKQEKIKEKKKEPQEKSKEDEKDNEKIVSEESDTSNTTIKKEKSDQPILSNEKNVSKTVQADKAKEEDVPLSAKPMHDMQEAKAYTTETLEVVSYSNPSVEKDIAYTTESISSAEISKMPVQDVSNSTARVAGMESSNNKKRREKRKRNHASSAIDESNAEEADLINNDTLLISGKITDQQYEAIPFASVYNQDKDTGVVSDMDGKFRIEAQEGDAIIVSYIGYTSTKIEVSKEENIDVILDAGADLDTFVVKSGKIKKENRAAQPSAGYAAFEEYLVINAKLTDEAKNAGIKGKVVLALIIDTLGNISNIEVLKGLGYGCDEEAIRLIIEGPAWDPAIKKGKSISEEVKIKVPFE